MEITKVRLSTISNSNLKNSKKETATPSSQYRNMYEYPKNFVPYFGARLERTPENFYDFNSQNIPATVMDYLNEDKTNREKIAPFILQQEAFAALNDCKTVQEIKDAYPNESLFENLHSLNDKKAKRGYLYFLRSQDYENTPILKNGEDLTVYLVKKIYLEGQTLEELNASFDKDVNEDYKMDKVPPEQQSETGMYFNYSTLSALGIPFPNLEYWHSFRATRIEWYKQTSRNYSPESREKHSRLMSEYWLSLSPEEKAERIEKLRNGNNPDFKTFVKFQSPIMVFATAEINLSDRLSDFWQQKSNEAKYVSDFTKLDDNMREVLTDFWEANPDLKNDFSKAIKNSIKMFQNAEAIDESAINTLERTANIIQDLNKQKGYLRDIEANLKVKAADIEEKEKDNTLMEEIIKEESDKLAARSNALTQRENSVSSREINALQKERNLSAKNRTLEERASGIAIKEKELNSDRQVLDEQEKVLSAKEKQLSDKEQQLSEREIALNSKKQRLEEEKISLAKEKADFEKTKTQLSNNIQTQNKSQQTTEKDKKSPSLEEKRKYLAGVILETIQKTQAYCPDEYNNKLFDFIIDDRQFDENFVNTLTEAYETNNLAKLNKISTVIPSITERFRKQNKCLAIAVDIAIAQCLYKITNDSKILTTTNVPAYVQQQNLTHLLLPFKEQISALVTKYTSGMDDKVFKLFFENMFAKVIEKEIENKRYLTLNGINNVKRLTINLKNLKAVLKNSENRNKFMNFVKDYEGVIKYITSNELNNTYDGIYLIESIIDDYLEYCENVAKYKKK